MPDRSYRSTQSLSACGIICSEAGRSTESLSLWSWRWADGKQQLCSDVTQSLAARTNAPPRTCWNRRAAQRLRCQPLFRPLPIRRPVSPQAQIFSELYATARVVLVPGGGVEPPRPEGRRILSPLLAFANQPIFFQLQRLAIFCMRGP